MSNPYLEFIDKIKKKDLSSAVPKRLLRPVLYEIGSDWDEPELKLLQKATLVELNTYVSKVYTLNNLPTLSGFNRFKYTDGKLMVEFIHTFGAGKLDECAIVDATLNIRGIDLLISDKGFVLKGRLDCPAEVKSMLVVYWTIFNNVYQDVEIYRTALYREN
jgi:hypothetical protein